MDAAELTEAHRQLRLRLKSLDWVIGESGDLSTRRSSLNGRQSYAFNKARLTAHDGIFRGAGL